MLEFLEEGRPPTWNLDKLYTHFDEYVKTLYEQETDPLPTRVPQTNWWLVTPDHEYLGRVSVRHHLNDELRRIGGHIGYDIRPSQRRRGHGTLICRLALEKAAAIGLQRVLITCDDDNIASARIIEKNGGVLQDVIEIGRPVPVRRYWVDLTAPSGSGADTDRVE